jgi:HEAT repeat protein
MDAAHILWELGPRAKPAAPTLMSALEDPDPYVRYSAAAALRQIAPESAGEIVPLLIRQLRQSDAKLRVASARGLEEFGAQAMPAVPELMKSIQDKDTEVQNAARSALKKIDPATARRLGIE